MNSVNYIIFHVLRLEVLLTAGGTAANNAMRITAILPSESAAVPQLAPCLSAVSAVALS